MVAALELYGRAPSILLRLARLLFAAAASALLPGCALSPLTISPTYSPEREVRPILLATTVSVAVLVADLRNNRSTVGTMVVALGSRTIVIDSDLETVVKAAIESELKDRGFQLGEGDVQITAEVQKVEVTRVQRSVYGLGENSAAADISIRASVTRRGGAVVYSETIEGRSSMPEIADEGSAGRAGEAFDLAFDDAVHRLFDDWHFIDALLGINPKASPSLVPRPSAKSPLS